MCVSS
jgi:hypothetical protein